MTHDPDLAREIFISAGATRIRIEEYTPGHWLAASREHGAGVTSDKDEAFDTVQEVAAHLVGQKTAVSNASDSSGPRGGGADSVGAGDDLGGGEATPPRQPQQGLSEDEAHGEVGGDTDASEPGGSLSEKASIGEAESAPDMDNGMGSAESGSAVDEPASVAYDAESPIDADFAEPEAPAALEGDDLADPPALEFGAEMAEHEEETAEEPLGGQDRFIGLDDLDRRRSLRIGDVVRVGASKVDADEFAKLQSIVVRETVDGTYGGDPAVYAEFVRMSNIRSATNTKVNFLLSASREEVEAFDPEVDWPE